MRSALSITLQHLAAVSVAFVIAAVALLMYTRNNDFPTNYHPDEDSKAVQILDANGYRNFNHPLLLLEAAERVAGWMNFAPDARSTVIAGRWTSAMLSAGAVFCVALAGYVLYGWPGLLVMGLGMALCPPLSAYARFFKEDAALAAGILMTLAASAWTIRSRSWPARSTAIALLGIACGLSCSAKYVGLAVVVPGLVAVLIAPGWRWWSLPTRLLPFVLIGLVTVAWVNYRAFDDPWTFTLSEPAVAGMDRETEHGMTEHSGISLDTPNTFCLGIADAELMLHLRILGAAALVYMLARHGLSRWGITLAVFFLTFAVTLAYDAIPFGRYALPLTVLGYVLCVSAIAAAVQTIPRARWRRLTLAAVVLLIVMMQGWRCAQINGQSEFDSRQQLRQWAAANLPRDAAVISDRYAMLDGPGDPWRFPSQKPLTFRVVSPFSAWDDGSLRSLQQQGFQYLVVCEMTYGRYLTDIHGDDRRARWVEQHKAQYKTLFASYTPIWQYVPDPVTHSYLSPEIRVYRIN